MKTTPSVIWKEQELLQCERVLGAGCSRGCDWSVSWGCSPLQALKGRDPPPASLLQLLLRFIPLKASGLRAPIPCWLLPRAALSSITWAYPWGSLPLGSLLHQSEQVRRSWESASKTEATGFPNLITEVTCVPFAVFCSLGGITRSRPHSRKRVIQVMNHCRWAY